MVEHISPADDTYVCRPIRCRAQRCGAWIHRAAMPRCAAVGRQKNAAAVEQNKSRRSKWNKLKRIAWNIHGSIPKIPCGDGSGDAGGRTTIAQETNGCCPNKSK